jgi:hypothetical protein
MVHGWLRIMWPIYRPLNPPPSALLHNLNLYVRTRHRNSLLYHSSFIRFGLASTPVHQLICALNAFTNSCLAQLTHGCEPRLLWCPLSDRDGMLGS